MKKVLFTATVDSHIIQFHLPFLKYFKEHGYEVHVATNRVEQIPYCDKKIVIPFERSPFKLNNLTAGWTSIMVTVTFFAGIQLISIWIMSEYVGRIYDETKKRPEYIIDKKINC